MATQQQPFCIDKMLETILRPVCVGKPNKVVVITSIRINNTNESEPFRVEVYLKSTINSTGVLFKFNLDAGDVLYEDTEYRIPSDAKLNAISNVTTANITINGYEESIQL